jgi:hypothetical protein
MLEASSPNETSAAITEARAWLADHAEDGQIASAMADLIAFQRESLESP